MGEITTAIAEAIRNRATSTTLVTYSFFWAAWHWQGVYVALFTNETQILEKLGYLKNEYLNTYFFGWHGWDTVIGLLVPLALTILFIWPFQKYVLIHAYSVEQKARAERKKVRLNADRLVEKYKADLLNNESRKINAQSKKVAAEAKLSQTRKRAAKTDPAILWDQDYEAFKKTGFYDIFSRIREAVYEHNGLTFISAYDNGGSTFEVGSPLLAYSDTEGLIQLSQKDRRISLTDKGKHFIKRYQQEVSF